MDSKNTSCTVKFFLSGHNIIDKHDRMWKNRHLSGTIYNKLYYNVSGEAVFYLNNTEYKMKPGYLYFIPKYTLQSFRMTSESIEQYFLHFDIEIKEAFASEVPVCVECDKEKVISLFEAIVKLENNRGKNVLKRSMRIIELYDYYLSCIKSGRTTEVIASDKRQTEIIEFIKKNYQRKITIEEIADLTGLAPDSVYGYFKKAFSAAPLEFINAYRIDRACLLLARTNEAVFQIAKKCGFEDYRYFSRVFKKRMGKTPLSYRAGFF